MDVITEDGAGWLAFLRSLVARGSTNLPHPKNPDPDPRQRFVRRSGWWTQLATIRTPRQQQHR